MTTTIKAIFKGQDGSCGYKTNNEYTLSVHHHPDSYIKIEKVPFGGWCDYGSMVSFLKNWDNIRRV